MLLLFFMGKSFMFDLYFKFSVQLFEGHDTVMYLPEPCGCHWLYAVSPKGFSNGPRTSNHCQLLKRRGLLS